MTANMPLAVGLVADKVSAVLFRLNLGFGYTSNQRRGR